MLETILVVLVIIEAVCLLGVTAALMWRAHGAQQAAQALDEVAQAVQDERTRNAVLAERLQALQPMAQNVGVVRAGMAELQAYTRARQELEAETHRAVQRLEGVLAGSQAKGAAGENLLEAALAQLPAAWQARDVRVGAKVVEFGLWLPNGLLLPIDHKWPASPLVEQFLATSPDEVDVRARLKVQIEAVVIERAAEVAKYVDPNLTSGFGVAVVPDAVFELCAGAQVRALAQHVVILGHRLLLPYLLLVFETTLRGSQNVDVQRLAVYLQSSRESVRELQEELEGRFARAMTMLANSRDHLAGELSKVQAELTSLSQTAERLADEKTELSS